MDKANKKSYEADLILTRVDAERENLKSLHKFIDI